MRRNKCLEVAPGAAGNQSQCPGVYICDRQSTRDEWGETDPYSDGGGRQPKDHERRCDTPGIGAQVADERRGNQRDDYAA
ncbi:MAG TPA: hypothetical protein VE258_00900, partial [Ktedonobacterales bacterium]|nr:hypothetical protein [Ktedonobacterales bacterium]